MSTEYQPLVVSLNYTEDDHTFKQLSYLQVLQQLTLENFWIAYLSM